MKDHQRSFTHQNPRPESAPPVRTRTGDYLIEQNGVRARNLGDSPAIRELEAFIRSYDFNHSRLSVQGRGGLSSRKLPADDSAPPAVVPFLGDAMRELGGPCRMLWWLSKTPLAAGIRRHAHDGTHAGLVYADAPEGAPPLILEPYAGEPVEVSAEPGTLAIWPADMPHSVAAIPGATGARLALVFNAWTE